MSTVSPPTRLSPDDLLALPDEKNYELVDGQLVERNMGNESSWVSGQLYRALSDFVEENRLGWVLPAEAGYRCFPHDPGLVRKPDVSFIKMGRLPDERPSRGYETIAPDLAVEVTSPRDLYSGVVGKVEEYVQAGVSLVWVINPESRTATVHRGDGSIAQLHENDQLDGEQVLPGFACRLGDLLLPPAEKSQ